MATSRDSNSSLTLSAFSLLSTNRIIFEICEKKNEPRDAVRRFFFGVIAAREFLDLHLVVARPKFLRPRLFLLPVAPIWALVHT